jgi:hypothetical protein
LNADMRYTPSVSELWTVAPWLTADQISVLIFLRIMFACSLVHAVELNSKISYVSLLQLCIYIHR